jgi:hypothetical protein
LETVELSERVLGPTHPDTLKLKNSLAITYAMLGRYEKAVEVHSEVQEARKQVLGEEDPDTL